MEDSKNTIQQASAFIFDLLKDKLSEELVYHNINHTREVVKHCEEMAKYYDLAEPEKEMLLVAAWFHDVGYINSYKGHEEEGVEIFHDFAKENKLKPEIKDNIDALILSTRHNSIPSTLLEEILHDADILNVGSESFFEKAELLRVEWERFLDRKYTAVEWSKIQIDFLVATKFYTEYAQKEYGETRDANIKDQRKKHEKYKSKKEKKKIKERKLGRGLETMYKSTYRNHINLSSIADAKANMMISINTIIMSVIVTLVGSGFTFSGQSVVENIRFTVPIIILLISALVSVIFAILSARPEVTSKKVNKEKVKKKKSSVLFFGNFVNMEMEEFVKVLKEFRKNQGILYDNMSIDIYYLGTVLTKKYKMLRYSYNIFMGGLILCVISFIVIFMYTTNVNM